MREHPRVAVIGAGPAGCAAACMLGKAGLNTFLLERGQPGKEKACGDALLPSAIKLLHRSGIDTDAIVFLGGHPFHRIDLYNHDSLLWQLEMDDISGWIIPRAILDQKLRDVAMHYATIWYGTSLTLMQHDRDSSWRLTLKRQAGSTDNFQCDAVVLATGSSDMFAKRWELSGEPALTASITGYVEREVPEAPIFQFMERYQPGYGWVFPLSEGRINIGVCTLAPHSTKHLRKFAEEYLKERGISVPCRWRGGGGPLWSGNGHSWHHASGIVSCGDAAGLVDPISGEGITAALISGEYAGRAVFLYLQEDKNARRLQEYSHWVREHFSNAYATTQERQIWGYLCGK